MSTNEETSYFIQNKPSVIDLYTQENPSIEMIQNQLALHQQLFDRLEIVDIKNDIVQVRVQYKEDLFVIYLRIMHNDSIDLTKLNHVLTQEEDIVQANHKTHYIKSFVETKNNFVKAYYAQLKVLYLLSSKPLLIVDCSQWCIYSKDYLSQYALNNIDLVDSNLYKIKYNSTLGCIYTEGLDRFGCKDVKLFGINQDYLKSSANFLSQLSKCFIENGQNPNTFTSYENIFERELYICLIDMDKVKESLIEKGIYQNNNSDTENILFLSLHDKETGINTWYENDLDTLNQLKDYPLIYSSIDSIKNQEALAQATINKAIDFISSIDDTQNLMVLAKDNKGNSDWYYYASKHNQTYTLNSHDSSITVNKHDILNWVYRGITPAIAYHLKS